MQLPEKMKVVRKLMGGFLIVAAIGAVIGIEGILKAGQMNEMSEAMYGRETLGIQYTSEANTQLYAAANALRAAIISTTDKNRTIYTEETFHRLANARKWFEEGSKLFTSDPRPRTAVPPTIP